MFNLFIYRAIMHHRIVVVIDAEVTVMIDHHDVDHHQIDQIDMMHMLMMKPQHHILVNNNYN